MPHMTVRIHDKSCQSLPRMLQNRGPIVPVSISIGDQQRVALVAAGREAPAPVTGLALIDTGATLTCIGTQAAQQAGLPTVGTGSMMSATQASVQVPMYAAKIDIQGFVAINTAQAYGSPALDGQGIIALIGRDVLSKCILNYNGPEATFTLSI